MTKSYSEPKVVVILGTGFTQTMKTCTGLLKLWMALRGFASGYVDILTPRTWKADPEEVAKFLLNAAPHAAIIGVFYSYGGGWFFRRLQKEMQDVGLGFESVVLIDPVIRYALFSTRLFRLSILSVLSFAWWMKLKILSNVREVAYYHQTQSLPNGHPLKFQDPAVTELLVEEELAIDHVDMDNSSKIHKYVVKMVREKIDEFCYGED